MIDDRFWKLLEPVHDQAAAFCRKLTGSRDEGNDLYQDVVLAAARRFKSLKDESSFKPWLFRIIVNRYRNSRRRFWRRNRRELTLEMLETGYSCDPRATYRNRRLLDRLLSVLSAEDRALIVLHEIEDRPLQELAETFGKPEGTIKTRLFRARKQMYRAIARRLTKREPNSAIEATYAMPRSEEPNS
jgi:RNA polymerase sigma-70 factor (ECF subfamily)